MRARWTKSAVLSLIILGSALMAGAPAAQTAGTCTYSVTPLVSNAASAGQAGMVQVSAQPSTCQWSPRVNVSWLSISYGNFVHTGSGSFAWTAATNPGTVPREGKIVVGGVCPIPGTSTSPAGCIWIRQAANLHRS